VTDSSRLSVKVVPGSSKNAIAGWLGDILRVRVMAPPEKGKANAAVQRTIADALNVPESSVRITRGTSSPRKTVEIVGLGGDEVRRRLKTILGS
jgi:uncharacterized protein